MATPFRIRTFLVDDEDPARERMKALLARIEEVEVVGEAGNGDDALHGIALARPDLVFLDIEMPGKSGIEVAARLEPPRPRVVYCTAYDRYALKAFELNALDYLVKPVSRPRLRQTVERMREAFSERAELLTEMRSAEATQVRLLPRNPPPLESLDYAALCRPALAVGGDYYDFLPLGDGRLGVVLADVAGKGVPAAILMAGLQGRLQSQASLFGDRLEDLLETLNRSLVPATEPGRFITLFYSLYDDARRLLRYVNAGHNPPFLLRSAGGRTPEWLDSGGMVLGVLPENRYAGGEVAIGPGDVLVIYSDGLTEAMNPEGSEFGVERLVDCVRRAGDLGARELAAGIMEELNGFRRGTSLHDDLTLLVAKGR
jgi:serine phosphatase RsbU (regulator of sigma subunit)